MRTIVIILGPFRLSLYQRGRVSLKMATIHVIIPEVEILSRGVGGALSGHLYSLTPPSV